MSPYEEAAGELKALVGAAADGMLTALEGFYHDPAERLQELRNTLSQYRRQEATTAPGTAVAEAAPTAPVKVEKPAKVKVPRPAESTYTEGGYGRMPNLIRKLLPVMSAPLVKSYVVATLLAEMDGSFRISHGSLAKNIGAKDRQHAARSMRLLIDAGLIRQTWRGGPGRSNGYRLMPLSELDVERAKVILAQPINPGHRDVGPTDPMSVGPTDLTTQT